MRTQTVQHTKAGTQQLISNAYRNLKNLEYDANNGMPYATEARLESQLELIYELEARLETFNA